MISSENPVREQLKPGDIDRRPLVPGCFVMRNGQTIAYFADNNVELLKVDFVFEAGTALQEKKLQAASAINLVTEGSAHHSAREIAEFMDYRGIIVEKSNDEVSATLTLYFLPRYVEELLPVVAEMLFEPTYPEEELAIFVAKRRQKLLTEMQRTSFLARRRYYECLYGATHPLGSYAVPSDFDLLTVEDVRDFHDRYLTPSRMRIVIGGAVSESVLKAFDRVFGGMVAGSYDAIVLPNPADAVRGLQRVEVPGAVQNTLRVGRRLPMRWEDREYAEFMVLSTVLGGYFGSRLMTNIREEKGYTYGINAVTQIYRGSLVFHIMSDVGADVAEPALDEVRKELERLCCEPVGEDELETVRRCMLGDFMRSVDGVFERSERYCQMLTSGVDERFTDNYMSVLEEGAVTPKRLQELAQRLLKWSEMTVVVAGGVKS